MLTSILLATSLLGQIAAPAGGPDAELAARITVLVRQLDDPALEKRVAAEQALLELGLPALDHLPLITPRTSAETKARLTRVRRKLESLVAEQATQASRVTLQGEMSLEAALQAIQQQTGNQLAGYEGRSVMVRAAYDAQPFWEVLDDLLDQAGMTVNIYGGLEKTLTLQAKPPEELGRRKAAHYQAVFRAEPVRVEAFRALRNPQQQACILLLEVAWEPRMTPIALAQPLDQITAVDDQGRPLELRGTEGQLEVSAQSDIAAVELSLPFNLPDRKASSIASLKGTLQATLPGRVEKFEFGDLADAVNREDRRAAVAVVLEQVRRNNELYEVRLRVRYDDAAGALESHRGWIFQNPAYMLTASGQRLEFAAFEATRQEANEVGVAYLFDVEQGLEGAKFVYETPSQIVTVAVPYEFKEIPLP